MSSCFQCVCKQIGYWILDFFKSQSLHRIGPTNNKGRNPVLKWAVLYQTSLPLTSLINWDNATQHTISPTVAPLLVCTGHGPEVVSATACSCHKLCMCMHVPNVTNGQWCMSRGHERLKYLQLHRTWFVLLIDLANWFERAQNTRPTKIPHAESTSHDWVQTRVHVFFFAQLP